MRILMHLLDSVLNVNNFCVVDELNYSQGSGTSIFFQLIQEKSSKCEECNKIRYIPTMPATIQVKFDNIDSDQVITRTAVMCFSADDRSIWRVDMMPTDKIMGIVSANLTENGKTIPVLLDGRLNVISSDDTRFFC